MKILDAAATRQGLPFGALVEALRRQFIEGCEAPLRHTHAVGADGTMLLMPAWTAGGYLGVKTVMVHPANASRGLPGLHSTYMLYDATTGVPLALMDGNEITSRRTAAASALAASFVVSPGARRHLVVGAGRVGRLVPEAYRAVMDAGPVVVWSPSAAHAREAVEAMRTSGIEASVSVDLEAAAREADIVTCATLATRPLIRGEWLKDGCHLDLIGSFTPAMREADDACFADAAIYVDTDEAAQKSGDLLGPISRGVFGQGDIRATLATLCRDPALGREHGRRRTVFKSVGNALEDLAAAMLVMRG